MRHLYTAILLLFTLAASAQFIKPWNDLEPVTPTNSTPPAPSYPKHGYAQISDDLGQFRYRHLITYLIDSLRLDTLFQAADSLATDLIVFGAVDGRMDQSEGLRWADSTLFIVSAAALDTSPAVVLTNENGGNVTLRFVGADTIFNIGFDTATRSLVFGDIPDLGSFPFLTMNVDSHTTYMIAPIQVVDELRDAIGSPGTNGQVLTSTGSTIKWESVNLDTSLWRLIGAEVYPKGGRTVTIAEDDTEMFEPTGRLNVKGRIDVRDLFYNVLFGKGQEHGVNLQQSIGIGHGALDDLDEEFYATGWGTIAIGVDAGKGSESYASQIIGYEAGVGSVNSNSIYHGYQAGIGAFGNYNIYQGYQTGKDRTESNFWRVDMVPESHGGDFFIGDFDADTARFNASLAVRDIPLGGTHIAMIDTIDGNRLSMLRIDPESFYVSDDTLKIRLPENDSVIVTPDEVCIIFPPDEMVCVSIDSFFISIDSACIIVEGDTLCIGYSTGGTAINIYTADGVLTGPRIVQQGDYHLFFRGAGNTTQFALSPVSLNDYAIVSTNTNNASRAALSVRNNITTGANRDVLQKFVTNGKNVSQGIRYATDTYVIGEGINLQDPIVSHHLMADSTVFHHDVKLRKALIDRHNSTGDSLTFLRSLGDAVKWTKMDPASFKVVNDTLKLFNDNDTTVFYEGDTICVVFPLTDTICVNLDSFYITPDSICVIVEGDTLCRKYATGNNGINLYTADGTLTDHRLVNLDSKRLTFYPSGTSGLSLFRLNPASPIPGEAASFRRNGTSDQIATLSILSPESFSVHQDNYIRFAGPGTRKATIGIDRGEEAFAICVDTNTLHFPVLRHYLGTDSTVFYNNVKFNKAIIDEGGLKGTAGQVLTSTGTGVAWDDAAGGEISISSLLAAEEANTIDNEDYTQKWEWNTLSGSGLHLSSTSTAAAGNAQKLLNVELSGENANSNQTTYAGYFSNTHTGTAAVNYGVYGNVTSGYGVYGNATSGDGVYGNSDNGTGVLGFSNHYIGIWGISNDFYGVVGQGNGAGVYGESNSSTGVGVYGTGSGAAIYSHGRLLTKQAGAQIAQGNNTTLFIGSNGGNAYQLVGTADLKRIDKTGWVNGSEITLLCGSSFTVKHGEPTSGDYVTILMADGNDFIATPGSILKLMLCQIGGVQAWRQVGGGSSGVGGIDVPISSLLDAENDNTLSLGEYRQTWVGAPANDESHIGLQVIEDITDYTTTNSGDTTAAFIAEVKGTTETIAWPVVSAAGIFKYTGHIDYSGDGPEGWALRANSLGSYASAIYAQAEGGYGIYSTTSGGYASIYGSMTGSNSIAIDGHTSQSSSLAMRAYNSHATAGTALAVQTEGPGSIGLNMINRTTATYNNAVVDGLTLNRTLVSGSAAAGLGNRILFNTSTSGSTTAFTNSITSRWASGDRNSLFMISGSDGGTEKVNLVLNGNGQAQLYQYGSGDFTDDDPPTYIAGFNSNGVIIEIDPSDLGGGGGGSTALSDITAAEAANTIDNGDYAQRWEWNTLSGSGLHLSSTSIAAAGNAQKLLNVELSGANANSSQSTYAGYFSNTHTGAAAINYGIYGNVTSGTGIYGNATTGTGVYGNSVGGRGVVGNSTNYVGIWGQSNNNHGVYGTSNSSTGAGVYGTGAGAAIRSDGRLITKQGDAVASANNLALGNGPSGGNVYEITGTTQINLISNTGWFNGSEVTLLFRETPTIKNNQTSSGSNIKIMLAGGADFVASADDMLTLILCTVNGVQAWREKCRSVN